MCVRVSVSTYRGLFVSLMSKTVPTLGLASDLVHFSLYLICTSTVVQLRQGRTGAPVLCCRRPHWALHAAHAVRPGKHMCLNPIGRVVLNADWCLTLIGAVAALRHGVLH